MGVHVSAACEANMSCSKDESYNSSRSIKTSRVGESEERCDSRVNIEGRASAHREVDDLRVVSSVTELPRSPRLNLAHEPSAPLGS